MESKTAETDYPIHELLAERWSPRAFADRPVEREKLLSLLEAARWAPSSYNEQPWRFLIALRENQYDWHQMLGCLVEGNQKWAKFAPILMLTIAATKFEKNGKENRVWQHDIGLAMANLSVEATARGLYVHQMVGIEIEKVRETYRVPEGYEPVTAAAIGYMGEPEMLPDDLKDRELQKRTRRPIRQSVFAGEFGSPAPWLE